MQDEPFGVLTVQAPQGALGTKWRKVQADLGSTALALARCRANIRRCSSGAREFTTIIKRAAALEGHDRIAVVNRRVNAAIRYVTDQEQWHAGDVWSAPLDADRKGSFETGLGDCEDYAIAKYAALRAAGTSADDLRLLVAWDKDVRSHHAVLAVRDGGTWLVLDNRWSRPIADGEASFLTPLFALNAGGVQQVTATRPRPADTGQDRAGLQSMLILHRSGVMQDRA
ncbi:transglutaminase-like cysteine peptidase [Bradyrhizobium japonicum]|uniref:transglutaminase-like cysteine peptidase n=1 Tax=Bradyrhizobium japonicum TaxID=375 RepID=UPI001BAD977D|nr:transglutaminase-like cysteine peptidase [Bradyrhizobium japonicum]MBR0956648.1 transglutaminase-like cysteine peptidase [Bradyrhizobium japonicum]